MDTSAETRSSVWAGKGTIDLLRSSPARVAGKLVLLALAMLLLMLFRRPDQIFAPYVWVEDGLINVPDYLNNGWYSLAHPIAGYYSLPIKFLHALSMSLSFRWFPEISVALCLAFTYAVLCAIAFSPTRLRWPFLCALAVLLIPTDAEVFAVSLYAGWWGSLLALLPLFWVTEPRHPMLRLGCLALGALSSPLILALLPLYAVRFAVLRQRIDAVALLMASVLGALQAFAMSKGPLASTGLAGFDPSLFVSKFFGYYFVTPSGQIPSGLPMFLGLALILFLAISWFNHRRELGLTFLLLASALAACALSSIMRQPLSDIYPMIAGPRYFFFPFVLLSWTLIQLASLEGAAMRLASCMLLAVGARNMLEGGRRFHGHIDWRSHIQACVASDKPYMIPVHFSGDSAAAWMLSINSDQCRTLIRGSLFDNKVNP
jgi:hypothetical protein